MVFSVRRRDLAILTAGLLILTGLAVQLCGCGSSRVSFHYPGESMMFPTLGEEPPALFVEFVNDLRPGTQRGGAGSLATVRFPADEDWDAPVAQIYYQALVQDLTQTDLVQVVPLRSQADYVLEVDLNHMGCKVSRRPAGYVLTAALGAGIGYAAGGSGASTAVGALLGIGAIPVPTRLRAVCEVRLRVYDSDREPFWDQTCLGEITKDVWDGITSRKDQKWVDEYLTVAVKRCNACLLGQLRQALVEAEEAARAAEES